MEKSLVQINQGKQHLSFKFSWLPRAGPVLFVTFRDKKFCLYFFCHRLEERCIKIGNHTSFLCARCTGLVVGVGLAVMLFALNVILPLYALGLICLPLLIDGFTQAFNLRKSNNPLRFTSGILFAIGMILIILQR
jgi:uncharacterized membrane protein